MSKHFKRWRTWNAAVPLAGISDRTGAVVIPSEQAVSARPPSLPVTGGTPQGESPHVYQGANGVSYLAATSYPSSGGKEVAYTYTKCTHDGDQIVYTFSTKTTIAGMDRDAALSQHADLIIDCADEVPGKPIIRMTGVDQERFGRLNAFVSAPPSITLQWRDMRAPNCSARFWRELLKMLPTGKRVVVMCFGGHGRTGTALSALLVAAGFTAEEAIARVRKTHCIKAVESKDQERYLARLEDEMVEILRAEEGDGTSAFL